MSPSLRDRASSTFRYRRVTRRKLFAAGLGLGVVAPARASEPQPKMSQVAVAYRKVPNGLFSCAVCTFFIRPRSCKVVSGDISPTGWCKLFDLPD